MSDRVLRSKAARDPQNGIAGDLVGENVNESPRGSGLYSFQGASTWAFLDFSMGH